MIFYGVWVLLPDLVESMMLQKSGEACLSLFSVCGYCFPLTDSLAALPLTDVPVGWVEKRKGKDQCRVCHLSSHARAFPTMLCPPQKYPKICEATRLNVDRRMAWKRFFALSLLAGRAIVV